MDVEDADDDNASMEEDMGYHSAPHQLATLPSLLSRRGNPVGEVDEGIRLSTKWK